MEREDTSWWGGVMPCWAHAQHLAPLLGHQCPVGRSRGSLLLHFPTVRQCRLPETCQGVLRLLPSAALGKVIYLALPRFRYLPPACLAGCLQTWSQRDSSLQGIVVSFCEWQEMLQDDGNKSIVGCWMRKLEKPHIVLESLKHLIG